MRLGDLVASAPFWSQPPLAMAVQVVVAISFLVVAAAVVADFASYHRQRRDVVESDRSFVETGSMTAFFVAYYLVIRFGVLGVGAGEPVRTALVLVGLALTVVGVVFNVWGRFALGSNWANQIKIYEGHTLKTRGPYYVVRHPLYASLIWIFIGGSLLYANVLSAILTVGVFLPMMYVRARKEEALLLDAFPAEYPAYRSRTGMFLPTPWRR